MKVSFIIPVYNVERYLPECMESVLAQTERDYEIILIDDGSTDGSGDMCDRYMTRFPDKIQALHQKNQGLSAARNAGIEKARGEFLFFLDSDDKLAAPNILSELLGVSNGCDIVSLAWKEVPDGETPDRFALPAPLKYYKRTYESGMNYLTDVLLYDPLYCWYPWRYLYRTAFWKESGFAFKSGIKYEDVDMMYRVLLAAGRIAVSVESAAYIYRTNRTGSTVNAVKAETYSQMLRAASDNIRDIEARNDLAPELKRRLNHNFSCMFYTVLIFSTMLPDTTARNPLLNQLRKEKWICSYTISGKQLVTKYLVRLIGVAATAELLGMRRKLQRRVSGRK